MYVKTSEENVPRINALLEQHGLDVMELSPRNQTLEEVFVELTKPQIGTERYIQ